MTLVYTTVGVHPDKTLTGVLNHNTLNKTGIVKFLALMQRLSASFMSHVAQSSATKAGPGVYVLPYFWIYENLTADF